MNDNEIRRLLRPLAGEPDADPRIDVAEAMRRGARLRQRHRATTGAAYAAMFAVTVAGGLVVLPVMDDLQQPAGPVSSASASAAPSEWSWGSIPSSGAPPAPEGTACVVRDFPVVDARLFVTDPTGRWAATGGPDPTGEPAPRIFDNGVPAGSVTVLDQPASVTALNSFGDAAVTSLDEPWARVGGTTTRLAGGSGTATAIGADGRIGGALEDGTRPVVWTGPAAQPVELPMPGGYDRVTVIGIGDDGTVAGALHDSGAGRRALVLWLPDDSVRLVDDVADLVPESMSGGWVIGREGSDRGFRYEIATTRYESLPGQLAAPVAVSPSGAIAGLASMDADADVGVGPYVLLGDGVRPLEQPVGTTYTHISGITEDGRTVLGTIETTDGAYRAVTWSC